MKNGDPKAAARSVMIIKTYAGFKYCGANDSYTIASTRGVTYCGNYLLVFIY